MGSSGAVSELAATELRLRALSWDISAAAVGRDCNFSGGVESIGNREHDPARASVGVGGRAADFAVAQAEDRTRSRRLRFARAWEGRRVSAAVPRGGRQAFPAPVVDFSRDSPEIWVEVLGVYFWRRHARQ